MRIHIITLHRPENCGSALQGFALCRYLGQHYGTQNVRLIDYIPSYNDKEGGLLRSVLRQTLYFIPCRQRKKRFTDFIDSNCSLTEKKYYSYEELCTDLQVADITFAGSDQIWNPCFPCGNDPVFFLQFVEKGIKMSYATSLGTDTLSKEELGAIADRIRDFKFVSVREECSVAQLKEAGVPEVYAVCDPTLLLPASTYDGLATDYKKLGKFVAVYLVEHSSLLDETLDYFRKKGYKIVGVGGYLRKYRCDIHIKVAGPADFLGLIRDASFVLATSFHAAVFSHIFQKKFAIIPPHLNPTRIHQLLAYTGLENRILTSTDQIPAVDQDIDYEGVQQKLDSWIQASQELLLKQIDEIGA